MRLRRPRHRVAGGRPGRHQPGRARPRRAPSRRRRPGRDRRRRRAAPLRGLLRRRQGRGHRLRRAGDTIAWTHRPAFISEPGVVLGRLDGNPFQRTLREIAARTTLRYAVNAVMNEEGDATAVAAGDPVAVQASLARAHSAAWLRPVDGVSTSSWPACTRPRATTSTRPRGRRPTPAWPPVRPSPRAASSSSAPSCPTAPATGRASATSRRAPGGRPSPAALIRAACASPWGRAGNGPSSSPACSSATASRSWARPTPPSWSRLGVASFDSVDAALAAEDALLGRRARVLAVADATATVVHAR